MTKIEVLTSPDFTAGYRYPIEVRGIAVRGVNVISFRPDKKGGRANGTVMLEGQENPLAWTCTVRNTNGRVHHWRCPESFFHNRYKNRGLKHVIFCEVLNHVSH